jgi:hypothetical protein
MGPKSLATYVTISIACALLLQLASCSSCQEQDDEKLLRAMIRQAVELATRHDLGELMAMTTDDFVANPGHHTRQEVKGILLLAFRRYGQFSIEHPRPSVDLSPSKLTATAEVPFLIVRQGVDLPDLGDLYEDPERWIEQAGEKADAYFLELKLLKTDDGWRVEKARIGGTRGVGSPRGF